MALAAALWIARRAGWLDDRVWRPDPRLPHATESSPKELADLPVRVGKVVAVADGDSVTLQGDLQVRYVGIDAPEWEDPFWETARAANAGWVLGREVEIRPGGPETHDTHGRILAKVYVLDSSGGPVCVNVELVRAGLAWVYIRGPDSLEPAYLDLLLRAQRGAVSEARGVWATLLERARERQGILRATRYRIHREGCPSLEGARARPVRSIEEELSLGKSPCRRCLPLGERVPEW